MVRGAGGAGVVVTYHDRITVERSGAESRREKYGALPGSLSEEAVDSCFPAGALQRRCEPELPLPGPQYRRDGDGNADAAELVERLKQHIPEKFLKMVRYFGFLANRVCGEKLPRVYKALGMDKSVSVANVLWADGKTVPESRPVRMRAVWRQDGVPPCHRGAECGRAEEKRAGYQSAEVYPWLMQDKCALE